MKSPVAGLCHQINFQLNATSTLVSTYFFPEADGPPCTHVRKLRFDASHLNIPPILQPPPAPKSQVDGGGVPDWSQMEVIPKSSSYHVPFFILSVSIAELVAFLYEVVRLKNDSCIDVDAAGPPPLCSPLIYNPYRDIS